MSLPSHRRNPAGFRNEQRGCYVQKLKTAGFTESLDPTSGMGAFGRPVPENEEIPFG
jgi:hypothetical protein